MKRHLNIDVVLVNLVSAFCFLVPIRLSLAYIVLIPAIALWLLNKIRNSVQWRSIQPTSSELALTGFILTAALSSLWGVDPGRSLIGLLRLSFFALSIPLIAEIAKIKSVPYLLKLLLTGQAISSSYTVLRTIFPSLPRLFIGEVSASGQLAMTVVILIGFLLLSPFSQSKQREKFLYVLTIPIIFAFILNLKRGPWLGAFIGLVCLFTIRRPRLVLPLIIATVAITFTIPSVRERLAQSGPHFFIKGGRSELWSIAGDIVTRFPLGVGYRNSPILQDFSTEVPKQLRHFHNNIINIVAETGWISGAFFIWWIASLIIGAFQSANNTPVSILSNVLGTAVIANQIAGLVEYNFGDSEVVLILYFIAGCLSYLATLKSEEVISKGDEPLRYQTPQSFEARLSL